MLLRFLFIFGALTVASHLQAATHLGLALDGKSPYRIVVSSSATPADSYAASELQAYVEKITGTKLPIVTDLADASGYEILVGESSRLARPGLSADLSELGTDGYLLRTVGRRLLIVGGHPRGTLNGVYSLLEEKLGVRWFTPELEAVPSTNRLLLSPLHETKLPQLEYREVFWTEVMRDADFAARHRLNGQHYKLTEKHGGRFAVYQPFVHSFDALVPPELYKDHPEYFPMIQGKRTGGYVQRCLSNQDVLRLSIAKVRQWIRENPAATIISVSQNDVYKNCECQECKSLDEKEGSPAATLLRFVNAIAEDIEKDHPRVRIDTLAYQYTRKPPKTIRPRHNVIVRLCSIECCFAHPLETCKSPANVRFRDDILAWRPVAPLLYVWDYTPNFAHYQQPFPNLDALQPNVRFFVNNGVKGLFEQGNYSSGGAGELGPLRAYVLAKLLWNPDTVVSNHVNEFCAAYYGKAADGIRRFLELMQTQVRGKDVHAHIFDPPQAGYLNDAFIAEADELLAQTEAKAEGVQKARVAVARLPIWYVQLARNLVRSEERAATLKRFLEVARAAGISNISEARGLEDWALKMRAP